MEFLHALFVGGDLRLQIAEVMVEVARRIFAAGEQRLCLVDQQGSLADQLDIVEQHALFVDMGGIGRHRARRDAANFGMVAA